MNLNDVNVNILQTGRAVSAYEATTAGPHQCSADTGADTWQCQLIPHAWMANTCGTSADTLPRQSAQKHLVMSFAQRLKRMATPVRSALYSQAVNRACAHYVMVSKFQWKPFWLATQRDPQNDWTATQNRVNYDVFAQAPFKLIKSD